jgi:hypothetical protein
MYAVRLNELNTAVKASRRTEQGTGQDRSLKKLEFESQKRDTPPSRTSKKVALRATAEDPTGGRRKVDTNPSGQHTSTLMPLAPNPIQQKQFQKNQGDCRPRNAEVCSKFYPAAETTERCGQTSFKFQNTMSGIRVLTKDITDYQAVKARFEMNNQHYFTFYPKSEKPLKAAICHIPVNTPAEDIAHGLLCIGFDVISVKQMTTTRRSPAGETTSVQPPLPLFLIALPRTQSSKKCSR